MPQLPVLAKVDYTIEYDYDAPLVDPYGNDMTYDVGLPIGWERYVIWTNTPQKRRYFR